MSLTAELLGFQAVPSLAEPSVPDPCADLGRGLCSVLPAHSFPPGYGSAPSRCIGLPISDISAQPGGKIRSFPWQTDPFGLNLGKETQLSLAVFNLSELQSN